MKRFFSFIVLFLGMIVLYPQTKVMAEDENLLINGNAESEMKGWSDPDNIWYPTGVVTPIEGKVFFWPSKSGCKTGYIYQDIDLTGYGYGTWVELSGWMANWDQTPHDEAILQLEFLDSTGNIISFHNRSQRNPQWTQHSIQTQIPKKTVTARIKLIANRYVGNDNDAYFDDLSFVVLEGTFNQVFITGDYEKAKTGVSIQLIANNGATIDPANYTWTSSYDAIATVNTKGVVIFHGLETDEVTIYAEDVDSGFIGVYHINSTTVNVSPKPGQIKGVTKGKVTKNSISMTWSSDSKAIGYYVYQYSATKKKWLLVETIKNPATNRATINKLKANTSYKFKIVAYSEYGDKYYSGTASKVLVIATSKK